MGKVSMALGFGVGYLLGTRAGRERFEEIKQTGARLAQRPEVQQAREKVRTVAHEKLPTNSTSPEPEPRPARVDVTERSEFSPS